MKCFVLVIALMMAGTVVAAAFPALRLVLAAGPVLFFGGVCVGVLVTGRQAVR